jgi:hypothetical protein
MSDSRLILGNHDIERNAGITLWVHVNNEHLALFEHQGSGKIHCRSGFTNTALMIGQSYVAC